MDTAKLSKFYVRSSLFGILSLVAAALNYSLYPILVRILNTRDFGDFAAIVAISNQILGILLAFNIISIYLVKSQPEETARRHAQIIQKTLIWFFLAATVLLLIASPALHSILKVQSVVSFVILAIILASAVPSIVWTGYLQGHKEMVRIGIYSLSASFAKLVMATVLAVLFGTTGAVWGLLAGSLVGLIVLRLMPGVKLPQLSTIFKGSDKGEKAFLLSLRGYFVGCILVVGGLSILQNYDITLAKILFSPVVAGAYSGISILSNALYYVSFLLIWIILPEIIIGDEKNNRRILGTAYKLLGALAVAAISVELVLKNTLAHLLLGTSAVGQGNLLIFASLYQLTLVGTALYAYYLLVNRSRRGGLLGGMVFTSAITIPAVFARSPLSMIQLLWASLLLSLFFYVLCLWLYRFRRGR